MQQIDDVVSSWLNGSEENNPAGPLYIQGTEKTETALTLPGIGISYRICRTLRGGTSCSGGGGCYCC